MKQNRPAHLPIGVQTVLTAKVIITRVLAAALVLFHALQQITDITQFSKDEHFCQGISLSFLAPRWGLGQDIVLV